MDDPTILKAHLDFIQRLGARYDGHPDIDHVDLGSIGWWGEWHLSGSRPATSCRRLENRRKIVDAYLAAFKKTPLVMLIGGDDMLTYAYPARHGLAGRLPGRHGRVLEKLVPHAGGLPRPDQGVRHPDTWKTAPVAWETCWDMRKWVDEGWSLRYIFNYALACHAS